MVKLVLFALLSFPVADWDALLQKYVDDHGRVDYSRLKSDDSAQLERVVAAVAAARPAQYPSAGGDAGVLFERLQRLRLEERARAAAGVEERRR